MEKGFFFFKRKKRSQYYTQMRLNFMFMPGALF